MKKFSELSTAQQEQVRGRFVLPKDESQVVVSEGLVALERISGSLVGCTVRNTNFHVHGNKQNGR